MGKTSTKILIALAALFVILAVLQTRRQGDVVPETVQQSTLFPTLDVAAVASVHLVGAGTEVTLRRTDADRWGVEQRAGYPVDAEKLRRLVLAIAQLRARDRLTENPEKYAALGLGEPPEAGSISLRDTAGNDLARVLLGQTKQPKGDAGLTGQFIRVNDDPAVYLVTSAPAADTAVTAWLDRTLLELAADRVMEVAVDYPGGGFAAVRRQPSDPLTLTTALPAGRSANSGALGDLGRALVNLNCEDVLPEGDPETADLTFDRTFVANTVDGLRYRIKLAERDGTYYARLWSEALPASPAPDEAPPDGGNDTPPAAPATADPAVAAAFAKRHQGWTYRIPKHAYERLAKTREDLLTNE